VLLSPSYCYPEDDKHYVQTIWPERYEPKIIAVKKGRARRFARRW
jgi:hypothetical protein